MASKALLFVGLMFAIVVIASHVSAKDLAETEQIDETNGLEDSKQYGGGGGGGGGYCSCYRCRYRCCGSAAQAEAYAAADETNGLEDSKQYGGGGGGGGGYCSCYRCRYRCCRSDAQAEAYAAAQAQANPGN